MATVKGIEISGDVYDIEDTESRETLEQQSEQIGNIDDLQTEEKTNLVAAINELAGGGESFIDPLGTNFKQFSFCNNPNMPSAIKSIIIDFEKELSSRTVQFILLGHEEIMTAARGSRNFGKRVRFQNDATSQIITIGFADSTNKRFIINFSQDISLGLFRMLQVVVEDDSPFMVSVSATETTIGSSPATIQGYQVNSNALATRDVTIVGNTATSIGSIGGSPATNVIFLPGDSSGTAKPLVLTVASAGYAVKSIMCGTQSIAPGDTVGGWTISNSYSGIQVKKPTSDTVVAKYSTF